MVLILLLIATAPSQFTHDLEIGYIILVLKDLGFINPSIDCSITELLEMEFRSFLLFPAASNNI